MQAVVANVLLRQKAKFWASASNGLFPLARRIMLEDGTQQIYVRWKDIENDPDAVEKVKWPMLKRNRVSTCTCVCVILCV